MSCSGDMSAVSNLSYETGPATQMLELELDLEFPPCPQG